MVDYHIHTDHSGDGKTPTEVQVKAAIEKGLSEICITSHYDPDSPAKAFMNFELDFPKYIADIEKCKSSLGDKIIIKTGVEIGLQADKPHVLAAAGRNVKSYPLDFVIASTHFMPQPNYHSPQQWINEGVDNQIVQAAYLNHTLKYLETFDDFDVIGHLTYLSRYSPETSRATKEMTYSDNSELYDQLFEILIRRGKGIEINTSMKASWDLFSPDHSIVRRYYEMGGRIITVGSDAHLPNQLGAYCNEAVRMLREVGFTAICTYDKRQPKFLAI